MKKIVYLVFFCAFILHGFSQENESEFNCLIVDHKGSFREQFVDFKTLHLDIKFEAKNSKIFGDALYTFQALRTNVNKLFLDAPNIVFKKITLEGKKIDFKYVEGGINLIFDDTLDWEKDYLLELKYETRPIKGLYFVGWNDKTDRARKQIWTQGQGIDNRHWIPGFDAVNDKLVTETKITFETGYEVISNGELVSKKKNTNNTTTWHYAMNRPHSLYLVMLAIGEYDFKEYNSKSGIISRQYFYPDRPETEKTTYQYTNKMMNWFEAELGIPYQWDVYKNVPVRDFMYGAMENTSATIFTDYYLQNKREALERNYVGTNAHELAHHWFGDLVTEWSGTHHWLHESFATHYSKRFMREVLGEDEYQWKKRKEQESSLRASEKNDLPVAHSGAGSSRHYPKGSFVIDMLRYVVGEEEYKKTIKDYLRDHAFNMVETRDFQIAFMKSVGMNLDWFFNQWIYKGGEPEYKVDYAIEKNKTVFNIEQIQEQNDLVGLFKMPIVFQVHYKDGSFSEAKHWVENLNDTIIIENKELKKVDYVLFDPNSNILKKVIINKSFKELLAQAEKAEFMIDRYDAVNALKEVSIEKKRDNLIALYLLEDFRAIKQNILEQLEGDKNPKTEQVFVYGMGDKHAKVRRAAIKYADISSKRYLSFYEEMLKDESYVNIEIALKKLCYEYPDFASDYLEKTKEINGKNYSLKLAWLNIAFDQNSKLAGGLVDYTSESFDFRTRIKAIEIIREKEYFDTEYMKNLLNASVSFNRRLKGTALKHLGELLTDKEKGIRIAKYIADNKWEIHDAKMLDDLVIKHGRKVYK